MGIRLSPLSPCTQICPQEGRAVTRKYRPRFGRDNLRCNEEEGDVKNGDIDWPEKKVGWSWTDIAVTMQLQGVQVCMVTVDTDQSRELK